MKRHLPPFLWLLALLPVFLLLVACGSQLPENRPSDFYLSYYDGGGMLPYGISLTVDGQTATQSIFNQGVTVEVVYQLTPDEVDRLYQTMVENRLDRIQTYEEDEVYDRGGTNVSVTADGATYEVRDSGLTFVQVGWQEEYDAVLEGIAQVIERPSGTVATQLIILWDNAFSMSNTNLHIQLDGDFVSLISELSSNQASIVTNRVNGRYLVTLSNASGEDSTSTTLDLTTSLTYRLTRQGETFTLVPEP